MISKLKLTLILLAIHVNVSACRCFSLEIIHKINNASYLGLGKVIEIQKAGDITNQLTVVINKTFRGQIKDTLFIRTLEGSCSVKTKIGEEYIFLSESNISRCNYIEKEKNKAVISLIECINNFDEFAAKFEKNENSISDFEIDIISNFSVNNLSLDSAKKYVFTLDNKSTSKTDFYSKMFTGKYDFSQFKLTEDERKKYGYDSVLSLVQKKSSSKVFYKARVKNSRDKIRVLKNLS